jgi:hypothetical protein
MPETPIREAVFAAIVAALEAADMEVGEQPVTIERNRDAEVSLDECPMIVVLDGGMEAQGGNTLEARYIGRATLAGWLQADTTAELHAQANLLHALAVRALIRPDPALLPRPLTLADGTTQVDIIEGGFRVEAASIAQSDQPMASFVLEITFDLYSPWGSPFITTP